MLEIQSNAQRYYKNNRTTVLARGKQWSIDNYERVLLDTVRRRAEREGRVFELELSDIVIPEYCPVLGLKIIPRASLKSGQSASVDRVDTRKDYTKDNVQIISLRANRLKNNATLAEVEKIYLYMKGLLND